MTFELLISAVNKDPEELARTMRIASDALIVVQDPPSAEQKREEDDAGTAWAGQSPQAHGDASSVSEEALRKDFGRGRVGSDSASMLQQNLDCASGAIPPYDTAKALLSSPDSLSQNRLRDSACPRVPADVSACRNNSEAEGESPRIRCFRQKGRGVGRSRNAALSHAQADICLFGDEDIIYDDGYEERILSAFASHPEASVITFNVRVDERRRTYWNGKPHRIRWYNYGRYPAYAIAVRRRDILKNNIRYSTLFGGGARYSNGEDSLFLHDCLKAGLVLFADTAVLGEETYRESTWFRGYTDKFFYDRGVLYHFLYGKAAAIFGLRFLLANRKEMLKECSLSRAYALLRKGIRKGSEL